MPAGRHHGSWPARRYPTYTSMMAREGVSPEGMAVIGDETAVRARFAEFFAAGADDILCAEFADNDEDRQRTRACLTDLLAV
jgi:hypothetical protein